MIKKSSEWINKKTPEIIYNILLLEDKNILISVKDGLKLWTLNNFKLITYFVKIYSNKVNWLYRMNEDNIIIETKNTNL